MRMIDQEKVITALECCKDVHQSGRWASGCIFCGYSDKHRPDCFLRLADDAAELLKKQEPKMVKLDEDSVHCPSCGNELFTYPRQKYCDECGQAVKWE